MTQPDWTAHEVRYNILVFLVVRHAINDDDDRTSIFRLAYRKTVDVPTATAAWDAGIKMREPADSPYDITGTYLGLITDMTPLRCGFGLSLKPSIVHPTITLTVARSLLSGDLVGDDGTTLYEALQGDFTARAGIFLPSYDENGQCSTVNTSTGAASDLIFHGDLRSDGVLTKPGEFELTLKSRLWYDDKILNSNVFHQSFSGSGWMDLDPDWEGKPQPILIGDWTSTTALYAIEVVPIMSNYNHVDLQFQISDTNAEECPLAAVGFGAADDVLVLMDDGTYEYRTISIINENEGYLRLSETRVDGLAPLAWQSGMRAWVKQCKGICDPDTDALLENPARAIYVLMHYYAGLSDDYFDLTSLAEVSDFCDDHGFKCRRWIDSPLKISDIIAEIMFEFGILVHVDRGQYVFALNKMYTLGLAQDTFYGCDIKKDSFQVQQNPDGFCIGDVYLYYCYNPHRDKFLQTIIGDLDAYAKRERIESDWIWESTTATAMRGYLKVVHGMPLKAIKAGVICRLMSGSLCDIVAFEHADEDGIDVQIWEAAWDLPSGVCNVTGLAPAWDYKPGAWTASDAPDYATATEVQRRYQGFWTDTAGHCADPPETGDEQSDWSL